MKIMGYRREDGKVGIRNHLLVIPTSICASEVATRIASKVKGAISLPNQHGCAQIGADLQQTISILIGLGKNPNVGRVLVVGLGCESVPIKKVAREIGKTGKTTDSIIIQECGGTLESIRVGIEIAKKMALKVNKEHREEADVADLSLAIECGGSDTTSGLASNLVAGYVSDKLVKLGGTSIFSETPEFIGAEHLLARRSINKEVGNKILKIVRNWEEKARYMGMDLKGGQPTPGNINGGISTLEEKSLGCILKSGTAPIQGVLDYGEKPKGKGLWVMDTPGQDIESITGMTAGGAQLVLFTTGRGTPTGSPIVPVVKITGNPQTYKAMGDNIDINVSGILERKETIREIGEKVYKEIIEVANGKLTKAEVLKHREFGIYKLISTF